MTGTRDIKFRHDLAASALYDTTGRAVTPHTRGIIISNGRKCVNQ